MARFMASDARKLAGATLDEKIDALLEAIKVAATNKKRVLRTGYDYREDQDLWINGGYKSTPEWLEAKKILEGLGYEVSFYYQDCSFATDLYTLIKW